MIRIEMVTKMCATLFMALCIVACSPEIKFIPNDNDTEQVPDKPSTPDEPETPDTPEEPDVPIPQPSEGYPTPDTSIEAWSGAYADDGANDIVGDNVDFFHELNSFTNLVVVKYNGATAEVTTTNSDIAIHQDGAYVTVDMQSKGVANTEVVIVGRSSDGALKIYSNSKYKLSLYGVDLCSQRGPAINSQSKKRVFLNIYPETTNRLSDCATYSEDSYTMPGVFNEDRKGALFAEGNIIVSGHGALVVSGRYNHAIVSDGCYYQRPGATVVVTESAKNGIHAKGDSDDGTGVYIAGGVIDATIASTAGKGIKSDMDVIVEGGVINVTTTGDATYDSEERDTSSAAGIKADGNIDIRGGRVSLNSSGSGGKGLNADTDIIVSGGAVDITTSGGRYTYSSSLTSSPKGIKADGKIEVKGGKIEVEVTGRSEGSEGIESKSAITIDGGEVVVNAYDDGINAASGITVNGGRLFARASNNDGIDSNGKLTLNGGLVVGVGASAPEAGVDVDKSNNFVINGGTIICLGASLQSTPSTESKQCSVAYGGISATEGKMVALLDAEGALLFTFEYPRTMSSATLFFSTPDIVKGETYTLSGNGSLTSYTDRWMYWYMGGIWSGGTVIGSFTPSSVVTTVGSTGGGPGGGGPGGGGGWRP